MRHLFRSVTLLLIVAAGWLAAAHAQTIPTHAYLRAQCEGTGMRVTLTAHDLGEHPEIVGFHIDRRTLGSCEIVRITPVPLARVAGTDFTVGTLDSTADPSLAHDYRLVGVDAQGQEIDPYLLYQFPNSSLSDTGSCSDSAPIAHGRLEDLGWALFVYRCPGGCYWEMLLDKFPESLRDLAGTGTPVLVYGTLVCGTVEGCLGRVTNFSITPYAVGVETRTWSSTKALYRD